MALPELLARVRDEIVRRFEARLRESPLVMETMSREDALDSLVRFLDLLVELLGHAGETGVVDERAIADVAQEHGLQRLRLGFDVEEIVREYAMLRGCVVEVLDEMGESLSSRLWSIMADALGAATQAAVHGYVTRRDEELRARTAEHFAFIAHEIRNPLATATLALTLLRRKTPPEASRTLDALGRSLDRLGDVVDQALIETKVRVEGGVRREHVDVPAFLRELALEVDPIAEQKGIKVSVEAPEGLSMSSDRRLLRSTIANFARNAVKFTRDGGRVVLRARRATGALVMEVEDQCGGLPEGAIEKVFDPFVQLGKDRTGFGLGLSIARQAAEALGGAIHVRDVPGRGCIFAFELPEMPSERKEEAGPR